MIDDQPSLEKRIVVSLESNSRITDDGIMILSVKDFIGRLWGGKLF